MNSISVSPTLRRLLSDCATICTVDCCRQDAFDLAGSRVEQWLESERIDRTAEIASEIERLLQSVLNENGAQVRIDDRDLMSTWKTADLRDFLEAFRQRFRLAVSNLATTNKRPPGNTGQ